MAGASICGFGSRDCKRTLTRVAEAIRRVLDGVLFHSQRKDSAIVDFEFDGERRAGIKSLDDGAAHQNASRELFELKGIEDGMTAGISDHRMLRGESVIGRKLREVVDVFELALTEWGVQRKGPIEFALAGRPWQANNERRNVFGVSRAAEYEFF